MKTPRCAIYTRISLDKHKGDTDEGLGVARQLEACLSLAERLGWQVVAHFDDNDTSAYSVRKKRKGYEELLDAMKNSSVDAVICWHTDRLYRRMGDLERLIDIAEANKIDIRTVAGGDLDLSTSAGRMVARILGSVANAESEHKGERQRAANKQKAVAGKWQTANRPFGYTDKGEPLEPEATAFRKAVVDVLAGKSIQAVAREWNAAGLKTTLAGKTYATNKHTQKPMTVSGEWNSLRIRRLLMNPRYAALRVHQGVVVGPGNWTPLIDPEVHKGLVAMLSDPSRIKCLSFERKYIGSGLYRCGECGATMKATWNKRTSQSYCCRIRSHVVRSGRPLDDYVTATILERMSRPDASSLLANQGIDVAALGVRRDALQRKLDKITRMFDDDAIDAEQFRTTSVSTRNKLAVIDKQLAEVTRTSPAAALAAADDVWALWQGMSPTQRADAIDEVAVVTVLKSTKGLRRFDPQYVRIEWKRLPNQN